MSGESDPCSLGPAVNNGASSGDVDPARVQMNADAGRSEGRRRVIAVGLTGGIGAGKSTALAEFSAAGALILSADRIVHDLYEDPSLAARVVARLGPGVMGSGGGIDRSRLATVVRNKADELRWLEEITHPLVTAEIERAISAAPDGSVLVCEVPLLFEAGLEEVFDLVVTIEASESERRRRSAHRTHPDAFAEFERLQTTTKERTAGSDLVFHNEDDVSALRTFVRDAYARALALLEDRPS